MAISNILILGGGMAGVASALAIHNSFTTTSSTPPKITIYELRPSPSTIGGAVSLTPTALRCLDLLGVLSELRKQKLGAEVDRIQLFALHNAASLGELDFRGPGGTGYDGYKGLRILRGDLLQTMLAVVAKTSSISIEYGKKVTGLSETASAVTVSFQDGTQAEGDLVLGCDGIHSATRMLHVEPERVPTYSGIASAYSFTKKSDVMDAGEEPFFQDSALYMTRQGALLTTYCNAARDMFYMGSIMEKKEEVDREGWRAVGSDQEGVRADMLRRFGGGGVKGVKEMVEKAEAWFLYPVFLVAPNGKWSSGRVLLLGDAAHAMPPRGESIGYALEDAIIFAEVLKHFGLDSEPANIFACYDKLRRDDINAAHKSASFGFSKNMDSGWLKAKLMEWVTPAFIWLTAGQRAKAFAADPRKIDFSKVL